MSTQPIFTSLRSHKVLYDTDQAALLARVIDLESRIEKLSALALRLNRKMGEPIKVVPVSPTPYMVAMRFVCEEFGVISEDVLQRSNSSEIVAMRRVLWRLLREQCRYALPRIGRMTGFHHTTVINSLEHAKADTKSCEIYERVKARYADYVAGRS